MNYLMKINKSLHELDVFNSSYHKTSMLPSSLQDNLDHTYLLKKPFEVLKNYSMENMMIFQKMPSDSLDRLKTYSKKQKKRSEEHTSELQSRFDLVCRLLLEKKKE